jgi:hypothetical protein
VRHDYRSGWRTSLRLAATLLAATLTASLIGCHATATPPVTHMNILTVTPAADATSATEYNFYRSTNGGAFVLINPAPQFGLVYDDLEITAGVVYQYRATAVVNGVESGPSVTVTLTAQ